MRQAGRQAVRLPAAVVHTRQSSSAVAAACRQARPLTRLPQEAGGPRVAGPHHLGIQQEAELPLQALLRPAFPPPCTLPRCIPGASRGAATLMAAAVAATTPAAVAHSACGSARGAAAELGCVGGTGQGDGHQLLQATRLAGRYGGISRQHELPPHRVLCSTPPLLQRGLCRWPRMAAAWLRGAGVQLCMQVAHQPRQRCWPAVQAGQLQRRQATVGPSTQVNPPGQQGTQQLLAASLDRHHHGCLAAAALGARVCARGQQTAAASEVHGAAAAARCQQQRGVPTKVAGIGVAAGSKGGLQQVVPAGARRRQHARVLLRQAMQGTVHLPDQVLGLFEGVS